MIDTYLISYWESIVMMLNAMFGVKYKIPLDGQGNPIVQESDALSSDPKFWINVGFHGPISGNYFLVVDPEDWTEILEELVETEEEMEEMLPSALKELLNEVCGTAIEALRDDFPALTISPPNIMKGSLDYPATRVFTCILEHNTYHPIEASLTINMMRQNIGVRLEAEIQRVAQETARAQKAENTIDTIMKNLTQGICVIDPNGTISPGASKELEKLFFKSLDQIEEHSFVEACPTEIIGEKHQKLLEWLDLVISAPPSMDVQDFMAILPIGEEAIFEKNSKQYTYQFNFVQIPGEENQLMMILLDVTQIRELEALVAAEEARATMIINVALDRDGFIQFLGEMGELTLSIAGMLVLLPTEINLNQLFRFYHTIRRGADTYGLEKVSQAASAVEAKLENVRKGSATLSKDLKSQLIRETHHIQELFNECLKDLEKLIAPEARKEKEQFYQIKESKINKLRNLLLTRLPDDYLEPVQNAILDLRKQPIGPVFQKYAVAVDQWAEEMNKPVQVQILGHGIEVLYDELENIFEALVLLIHYCVGYGLELPEVRHMQGKPETGEITLAASIKNGALNLIIADDGKGIDLSEIRGIALEKGLLDKSSAESIAEEDLVKLIFAIEFSNQKEVLDRSGQVVTVDSVQTAVEDLNGTIRIKTALGEGTSFEILIPGVV